MILRSFQAYSEHPKIVHVIFRLATIYKQLLIIVRNSIKSFQEGIFGMLHSHSITKEPEID
jgi:hypothetical protein